MAKIIKPKKAYENKEFLSSADGRALRILGEYLHPKSKFRHHKIMDTIVFFGSARLISKRDALADYKAINKMNPKAAGFAQKLRQSQ